MQQSQIPALCLIIFIYLRITSTHPVVNDFLTSDDASVLKVLLQRLEEGLSEETPVASVGVNAQREVPTSMEDSGLTSEREAEEVYGRAQAAQPRLSLAEVREFLSARDLKTVRNDSRKYSGCFGRRMDRIGSMTSLGCNSVGRSNSKKRR